MGVLENGRVSWWEVGRGEEEGGLRGAQKAVHSTHGSHTEVRRL